MPFSPGSSGHHRPPALTSWCCNRFWATVLQPPITYHRFMQSENGLLNWSLLILKPLKPYYQWLGPENFQRARGAKSSGNAYKWRIFNCRCMSDGIPPSWRLTRGTCARGNNYVLSAQLHCIEIWVCTVIYLTIALALQCKHQQSYQHMLRQQLNYL